MLKKTIYAYFKLLDEKLENWTIVILVIAILIVLVSIIINDLHVSTNKSENSVININWKNYKLINE